MNYLYLFLAILIVLGIALYKRAADPKNQELGKILFAVATLALLMRMTWPLF